MSLPKAVFISDSISAAIPALSSPAAILNVTIEAPAPSTQTANPEDDVMYKLLDSKIEIPLGLLRQKHIFIATPCYGGMITDQYFLGC